MNEGPFARRPGLRAGAWVLATATAALLATACSAAGRATPPAGGTTPQIFTMKLVNDHPRLDRGVLTYTDLTTMQVRQTALFNVQVTDVGRGPENTVFTRQLRGRLAAPQDVPTGGFVSVQIFCGSGLTCTPRSEAARHEISGVGRSGTWAWDVAATSPGNSQITLTAIRYRGNTQTVRTQTLVAVGITVRTTPLYAMQAAVDARKGTIAAAAAAVLAAAGALGAVLALRRRKGRRRASARHASLSSAETVTWPAISRPVSHPTGPVSPLAGPVSHPADPVSSPAGPVSWPAGPVSWPAGSVSWPADPVSSPPGPVSWPPGPVSWPAGPVSPLAGPVSPPAALAPARRAFTRVAWHGRLRTIRPGWPRMAWPGWLRKAWLGWLLADLAVGVLALSLVRATTSKPPAFAIAAAAVTVVVVPLYFLPAFVARLRRVPDFPSVAVINGVLGWTFFGWVAALALALRDRRPETARMSRTGRVPSAYPARVAGSGPGVHEIQRRGAGVTLVLWQTPDDSLTCQDPDDAWVSRWTYCVSPGQDGRPQFVLTGERHGCLAGTHPGPQ
jgi:predicted secreted protein